ncbi:endonuclease [bacterium (Candidatus Torokbacteria) CG_4_10_14_0_2_um_filter_35_8]|nr:MAG: endonuclease [bacterium (Candidatus Torokbacteria) CG_4_10_14_0_2_um_filter_35_8]
MKNRQFYIYILTNQRHTILYIGVTNDLKRRIQEHKSKFIPGFTKRYNIDKLVYYEFYNNIKDAIYREEQIKGWTKEKKIKLIESKNPKWEGLAKDWFKKESNS